jgi:hypothetical protein
VLPSVQQLGASEQNFTQLGGGGFSIISYLLLLDFNIFDLILVT